MQPKFETFKHLEDETEITDLEFLYRFLHTHMFRCSHLFKAPFDDSTVKKMQTKYAACVASHFSSTAKKCFGDTDVIDAKDLSDETINKLEKCMNENQLLMKVWERVSTAANLEQTQYFKRYMDYVKNYESYNFGDVDQIDFQKWEQANHCTFELYDYLNCLQTKSNYYGISEPELEEAVLIGKTYDCFRPHRQYWFCFSSSVCSKLIYPCLKNLRNWTDQGFFDCITQPEVIEKTKIALQRYMEFAQNRSNYTTSEKTKEMIQKFKKFSS